MPQHAHRNADAIHKESAPVEDAIAVRVLKHADAALGCLRHSQAADVLPGGLGEEEAAAFIQRAKHRVGREVRAGGELHLEALRHAQGGEAGGLRGGSRHGGEAKCRAEEPEEKKARRFHGQRLTERRLAANRELGG